MLINTKS